jgi:hypothetical protein
MQNNIKNGVPEEEYTRRYVAEIFAVHSYSQGADAENDLKNIIIRIYNDGFRDGNKKNCHLEDEI